MPTVEQLWKQALPPGTDLIAGEEGIYSEVSWVVAARPTPPAFDRLTGNEFALIDVTTAKGLGVTLSSLVESLGEQGVSGFGILGDIPDEVKRHSQRHKIAVLRLPSASELGTLETRITSLIREERSRLYQQEQELTQVLMELALSGRGVESILRKLQELSGRNIALLGPDFESLVPPPESLLGLQKLLSRTFTSPPSAVVGLKLTNKLSCFLSPIAGTRRTEGYLVVAAPAGELQETDRLLSKIGALSLVMEMSRRQAVEATEDRFQSEMIESLLSGELSAETANERAKRFGLNLTESYAVMVSQLDESTYDSIVASRKACAILDNAVCHPHGDILVIIHPVSAKATSIDLRRLGSEVAKKLSDYLETRVSLGVGRSYVGTEGLRQSFQEAVGAFTMGKRLFGEGSVSFFGDLGIYRLLLSTKLDELRDFYRESIGRLAEHDGKHSGELLRTLEAVLYHSTLAETAQALHVHRNTLLYRLNRIQEIANINLDDSETRLVLHLALKVDAVIRTS